MNKELMTPTHPLWRLFCSRLGGPEGCNFHDDENGKMRFRCLGGDDQGAAFEILNTMENIDVAGSLQWMREHGGYCDCEILFNCDLPEQPSELCPSAP